MGLGNIQTVHINTGTFSVPGTTTSDGFSYDDSITRDGVLGLTSDLDFIPWSSVLCIKITESAAEWILKTYCECPAGEALRNGDDSVVNMDCEICNMFGVKPGRVISVKHPTKDQDMYTWYTRFEEILQFWARQSNRKTRLSDGTPVFNLDVPRVIYIVPTIRDSLTDDRRNKLINYSGGEVKRSFAYHDELKREQLIKQLKSEGLTDLLEKLQKVEPKELVKPKEVVYGRYDSIFS